MIDKPLAELLGKYPQIKLAILFGSQADGTASHHSDIDIGLLADAPLDSHLKLGLMEAIGKQFGRSVDIVDLFYGPEPVVGKVLAGRRLLGDDVIFAGLLSRHLLDVADFLPFRQRILDERRQAWIG